MRLIRHTHDGEVSISGKALRILFSSYGKTEVGMPDISGKVGNVRLSRLANGRVRGCSFCFPHGHETDNSKWAKGGRSWKYYRRTQYRIVNL